MPTDSVPPQVVRRVMTGVTGFVGSHFALRCLRDMAPPVALVRAQSQSAARARAAEAVRAAAQTLKLAQGLPPGELEAQAFDLAQPSCGLTTDALSSLRRARPSEFWHFAASLRYEERHRAEILEANLEGTRRALSLCRSLGCKSFVYVSTAYAAGRRRGVIEERLHDFSAGFNNAYEDSKARAEHAVFEFCRAEGLRATILRPSIVIGPHATKSTGGSTTGFYGFLRELGRVARVLRAQGRPIVLTGEPDTLCNLIPVDWLIDDIMTLADQGLENGGIHHNTCSRPLTIEQIGQVATRALGIPGIILDPSARLPSALEQMLARRTAFYGSYLTGSKIFARRHRLARELSAADIAEYVRVFLEEQAAASPREALVRSASG